MKRKNIIFFSIFYLIFFYLNVYAKNRNNKIDSLSAKIGVVDSCVQHNTKNIKDLVCKTTDAELHKKLEIIEKEIYDRDHKLTMNSVNTLLTIAGIVFALALGFFAISFYFSSKKWKDEFEKKLVKFSNKADKKLTDSLVRFKTDLDNKLNETEASFYYHFAIRFFNRGNYEVAIDFFEPLYKSEFRYSAVCRYLSECYFHTKNSEKAISYLNEALQSTDDNNYAYGIIFYLKEVIKIDVLKKDVCNFLNNEHSNPRGYYQVNTNELIKKLIDENCKEVQE